jgi:nitrite reductase (NO-forming)
VIDRSSLRQRARPVDRSSDRLITLTSIALAVAFLVAAIVAAFLPPATRRGAWLPLHLALAGAASTAIAGVMPFFSAAFAAVPPASAVLRAAAVGAVAIGAVAVSLGVVGGQDLVAAAGGVTYVAGIVVTGVAAALPVGRGLGPSRGLVTRAYLVALAEVAVGAVLTTLFLAGWPPVVDAWGRLRPAHAWLNLVGFVSLVIGTTLLHFFPTVVGARIRSRPTARVTFVGLAAGAPIVAVGFVFDSTLVAQFGAVLAMAGSVALVVYAARTWRTRARWTTDRDWHIFAMGGLVSAITWLQVGTAIAAGRVLWFGSEPAGWSVELIAGPLVVGWVGLSIVASATHLLPAVGPGDPVAHARQRALLGRGAIARLAAMDVGTAALSVGLLVRADALTLTGVVLVGAGLATTAVLLAAAILVGIRAAPTRTAPA